MALTRKPIPSPNFSSRQGAIVRCIVVHTAQGARTIEDLGGFFASPSAGVSSHVGIDDQKGVVGEYVKRLNKAWTASNANPVAVQAELCAFAEWDAAEWGRHPNMLDNCARWIAEEAAAFKLPIVKLTSSQAQGSGRGVCQHADLGSWGGGHWDCGPGFPINDVLEAAKRYAQGDDEMGYPPEFWTWVDWYVNTPRDPDERPAGVPAEIPDAWWEGERQLVKVSNRYGMTKGERDWIDWYMGGKKGARPDVPETIPDHWWTDHKWAAEG